MSDANDLDAEIIEAQFTDMLEGLGASDDYRACIAFFTRGGISEAVAIKLLAAIALRRFVPAEVVARLSCT